MESAEKVQKINHVCNNLQKNCLIASSSIYVNVFTKRVRSLEKTKAAAVIYAAHDTRMIRNMQFPNPFPTLSMSLQP